MREIFKRIFLQMIDFNDIIAFIGLAFLGYGTYQIYPPGSYITIGLILLAFGLWRYIRP